MKNLLPLKIPHLINITTSFLLLSPHAFSGEMNLSIIIEYISVIKVNSNQLDHGLIPIQGLKPNLDNIEINSVDKAILNPSCKDQSGKSVVLESISSINPEQTKDLIVPKLFDKDIHEESVDQDSKLEYKSSNENQDQGKFKEERVRDKNIQKRKDNIQVGNNKITRENIKLKNKNKEQTKEQIKINYLNINRIKNNRLNQF